MANPVGSSPGCHTTEPESLDLQKESEVGLQSGKQWTLSSANPEMGKNGDCIRTKLGVTSTLNDGNPEVFDTSKYTAESETIKDSMDDPLMNADKENVFSRHCGLKAPENISFTSSKGSSRDETYMVGSYINYSRVFPLVLNSIKNRSMCQALAKIDASEYRIKRVVSPEEGEAKTTMGKSEPGTEVYSVITQNFVTEMDRKQISAKIEQESHLLQSIENATVKTSSLNNIKLKTWKDDHSVANSDVAGSFWDRNNNYYTTKLIAGSPTELDGTDVLGNFCSGDKDSWQAHENSTASLRMISKTDSGINETGLRTDDDLTEVLLSESGSTGDSFSFGSKGDEHEVSTVPKPEDGTDVTFGPHHLAQEDAACVELIKKGKTVAPFHSQSAKGVANELPSIIQAGSGRTDEESVETEQQSFNRNKEACCKDSYSRREEPAIEESDMKEKFSSRNLCPKHNIQWSDEEQLLTFVRNMYYAPADTGCLLNRKLNPTYDKSTGNWYYRDGIEYSSKKLDGYPGVYRCEDKVSKFIFVKKEILEYQFKCQSVEILVTHADCSYFVNIYGVIKTEQYVCILQEYCEGGSLSNVSRWPSEKVSICAEHLLKATLQLHRHGVVHGDLKPGNVCIREKDKPETLCLIDFDSVKTTYSKIEFTGFTTPFLPPWWEKIRSLKTFEPLLKTMDIWAISCIVIFLITGICPWHKELQEFHKQCSSQDQQCFSCKEQLRSYIRQHGDHILEKHLKNPVDMGSLEWQQIVHMLRYITKYSYDESFQNGYEIAWKALAILKGEKVPAYIDVQIFYKKMLFYTHKVLQGTTLKGLQVMLEDENSEFRKKTQAHESFKHGYYFLDENSKPVNLDSVLQSASVFHINKAKSKQECLLS